LYEALLREHEGDVERLMLALGVQRYDSAARAAKAEGHVSTLSYGQQLLSHAIADMEDGIAEWVVEATRSRPGRYHHAAQFIQQVPPDICALVTARLVIDSVIGGHGEVEEVQLARAVGRVVEDESRLAVFKREAYLLWKELIREQSKASISHKRKVFLAASRRAKTSFAPWTKKDKIVVGVVLIDIMARKTRMITRREVYLTRKKKFISEIRIKPTDEVLEWMEKAEHDHAIMSPVYLPTLDPPCDWTTNWDGGYHGFPLNDRGLMRVRPGIRHLTKELTAVRVPVVFEAINAVQRTPWVLNENTLEVLKYFHDLGTPVAGLPLPDPEPLPPRPWKKGEAPDETVLKAWKTQAHEVHTRNAERIGHRLMVLKTLGASSVYPGKAFYYPMKLDFRGRAYPIPAFLEPQGNDVAKGLLQFEEEKVVERGGAGADWLSIQGANSFGEDKVSAGDRIKWVRENQSSIIEVAENPLDNRWWADAEKPWQFLSFCFEWAELMEAGSVESRLPVSMDGSNNGLQIFSLLLRDPVGGRATNCLPSDVPCDVYQDVADLVTSRLRRSVDYWAKDWLRFLGPDGMPRKAVKRPVMTLPYGAKKTTARDYFRKWYDEITGRKGRQLPLAKSVYQLSDMIWDSIGEVVPRALEAMDWLRLVASAVSERNKAIIWTTPIGLRVGQCYPKARQERVTTTLGEGVRRNIHYSEDNPLKVDRRKSMDAIVPNLVHSLDASCMYLTVQKAYERGVRSFSMVHDSFATHAADADILAECLREAYIEVFRGNFLMDFKTQIEEDLDLTLPDPPEQGSMDPEVIRDSLYFFL
jgi:DNA-directed RNA polymerase